MDPGGIGIRPEPIGFKGREREETGDDDSGCEDMGCEDVAWVERDGTAGSAPTRRASLRSAPPRAGYRPAAAAQNRK